MLSPYRVLDLTDEGALICGQILGDLGADVIVVEPPGGAAARRAGPRWHDDPGPDRSLNWWSFNRNKRGITLDLESAGGQARLRELVRTSDFLVESFAPGYLDGLGLGYVALSAINPRLVMVSITPFGQTGPKAHWAASDLTVYASSGALNMSGDDDRPPVAIPVPQAFLHAGAEAAAGALIAHFGRERDGLGQHVDVSAQTAAMMATQGTVLSEAWGSPPTNRMAGGVNFGGIPLKFVNPAKDGYVSVTILFGSSIGPFTRRLMEVMCDEGFVDEATRDKDWLNYTTMIVSGQEPLSELVRCLEAIGRFTASHTKAELFRMGLEKSLLIVPIATTEDIVLSPQLASRDYFTQVEHPEIGESVTYPGPFAKFSGNPIAYRRRPPLLGEHNAEVESDRRAARPGPSATSSPRDLPLAGLKIADFMWVAAGPWGTRYLADYGATVVRVENAARIDAIRTVGPYRDGKPGTETSAGYSTINAGKLGLSLNLAHPKGQEVAFRLAIWADVVTDSFSPGAMKRLGLDYDSLRAAKPDIISISSCLNGQTGPHAKLAGFGTMGLHIAGFGEIVGWPDRPPAGAAGAYTDYVAPKFTAAAILAALDHRRRTSEGQRIDFSQAEAAMHFIGPAILDYTVNGRVQGRRGNASPEHAPHGVFPVAGKDRWVAIAVTNEAQWQSLCAATHRTDWLTQPRFATLEARLANREAIEGELAFWTASRTVDEAEQILQAAGVPIHRVSTSVDALADLQLVARGHFLTVPHPEFGSVVIEDSRMRFSATPAQVTRPGPVFGQDSDTVLRDLLGLSDDEIVELVAEGVLD
jgi:crotonobetainyl-CoA:carnitine CoA-transferase CaiB-like acyl-CoA transferase